MMRICLIFEGSYPFTVGGVSSWAQGFIQHFPEDEFILWTIGDLESRRRKYRYVLPENVVEVNEYFLDTPLKKRLKRAANPHLSVEDKEIIKAFFECGDPDWVALQEIFNQNQMDPVKFFMSSDFLNIVKEISRENFPFIGFSDLFWTIRSMFLPMLYLIHEPMPEADLYHSASTGYAGVLGGLASQKYDRPYVVTEHGIYNREREEEILRSEWVPVHFKEYWISMFYMFSRFAYQTAQKVTSLYGGASTIQQEFGCPVDKLEIVSNGTRLKKFTKVPEKKSNGWIDIGAIVRIAPIKDLKTLLYTFSRLKQEIPETRLHVLGGVDDEEYYQECLALVEFLGLADVTFAGYVNIAEYMARLDFTVLTSISEGQPLALIESMAAKRPVIATNVGACKELIEGGEGDTLGDAGFCVPPMDQNSLLKAMLEMCRNVKKRKGMGAIAQARAEANYKESQMVENYQRVYEKAIRRWQESDLN
jgi:glycosyltransferase involved in cell wall biosynthesis